MLLGVEVMKFASEDFASDLRMTRRPAHDPFGQRWCVVVGNGEDEHVADMEESAASETTEGANPAEPVQNTSQDGLAAALHEEGTPTCHLCGVSFENTSEQRAHFRLDWHRFNVQRRARGQAAVDEDAFDLLVGENDAGSISGTDSDSDAELERQASVGPKAPRVRVQGEDGTHWMLWRYLLPWIEESAVGEVLLLPVAMLHDGTVVVP